VRKLTLPEDFKVLIFRYKKVSNTPQKFLAQHLSVVTLLTAMKLNQNPILLLAVGIFFLATVTSTFAQRRPGSGQQILPPPPPAPVPEPVVSPT
jgi:hypothetical protein